MKLRRAAMLALVLGWYLMVPPPIRLPESGIEPDIYAPFSQWKQIGPPYDKPSDCATAQKAEEKLFLKKLDDLQRKIAVLPPSNKPMSQVAPELYEEDVKLTFTGLAIAMSQCVASDDSRLKGN
jgi:hypothetical protein